MNGEPGDDLGDRGVSGLCDSGFRPSTLLDRGDFDPVLKFDVAKFKLGTLIGLDGILKDDLVASTGVDGIRCEVFSALLNMAVLRDRFALYGDTPCIKTGKHAGEIAHRRE